MSKDSQLSKLGGSKHKAPPGRFVPRLPGGDISRGAVPAAVGHAGRASLLWAIIASCLAWLLLSALGISPARAAQTLTVGSHIDYLDYGLEHQYMWDKATNDPVYCADVHLHTPADGTVFSKSQPAGPVLDYILYHGFEGGGQEDPIEREATQRAIWAYRENDPKQLTDYPGHEYTKRLYDEALAYAAAGGGGPEAGFATFWPGTDETQGVLSCGKRIKQGELTLIKESSAPELTRNNAAYSYEGIEYGVYTDAEARDAAHFAGMLKLTKEGTSNTLTLDEGSYWVVEASMPDDCGYVKDTTPIPVKIEANKKASVHALDAPQRYRLELVIQKKDAQVGSSAQGSASMAGAEFTVCFYAGAEKPEGTPTKTWVLKSDTAGKVKFAPEARISGDEFYSYEGSSVLPLGVLTVQETKAPTGYYLEGADANKPQATAPVHTISLAGDDVYTPEYMCDAIDVADEVQRAGISLTKRDAELGSAQGNGSFAGISFDIENLNRQAVFVAGKRYEPGEKISGLLTTDEQGHAATAADALPLGKYRVIEASGGSGYKLSASPQDVTLTAKDVRQVVALKPFENDIKRGGVELVKLDAETGTAVPAGEASLEGAQFALINISKQAVVIDGRHVAPGEQAAVISSGADGVAKSDAHALPFGRYAIHEIVPPKGYLLNTLWVQEFEIQEDGKVVKLAYENNPSNRVMRTGFHFNKVDEQSMERMAHTVFLMTSLTTGEAHVLLTDENGVFGSEYGDRTTKLNANDVALSYAEDGTAVIDEDKLDEGAGVWFSGHSDQTTPAHEDWCALPYDTYRVQELRCSANDGYELIAFTVRAHKDGIDIDMGTLDDKRLPTPQIETTLTNAEGAHVVPAGERIKLIDTVEYSGLTPSKSYVLEGSLHTVPDGAAFGEPVKVELVPQSDAGSVEVVFEFDVVELKAESLVAFEKLTLDGSLVASHEDLRDEGQTVLVPQIGTTLTDSEGEKQIQNRDKLVLVDTVTYAGLEPGKLYHLSGELYNKETAKSLGVRAEADFVAEERTGSTTISFVVDGSLVAGKSVVAFERLDYKNVELAVHANINDAQQTVDIVTTPEPPTTTPEKPSTTPTTPTTPKTPATPQTPTSPTTPIVPKTPHGTTPKTGDLTRPAIFILVAVAAVCSLVGATLLRRNLFGRKSREPSVY